MAKKAPATKPTAKRKSRAKKPVVAAVVAPFPKPIAWRSWLTSAAKIVALIGLGTIGGIWSAGGIEVGPGPVANDCLSQAHAADRVSQVRILRELAAQPFDGATDDGRKKAGEWFNAQRFRNRPDDYGPFTDEVSEAIAANAEAELAKNLEGK